MSLILSNVKDTKIIKKLLVEYITKIHYESEDENPTIHSEIVKIKYMQ